jgi:hypothetical protein
MEPRVRYQNAGDLTINHHEIKKHKKKLRECDRRANLGNTFRSLILAIFKYGK